MYFVDMYLTVQVSASWSEGEKA